MKKLTIRDAISKKLEVIYMAVAHKGSISMGMVLIPIGLYKTTVDNDIHFNQLEKESKARIKYKKYCSHCGKEVQSSDIIKGYELF